MKIIGLIGGMSWKSSLEYYRIINEKINEKLGKLHSAKSLMFSLDFEEIEKLVDQNNWVEITQIMIDAAQRLEKGGADFIIICANTAHKIFDDIQKSVKIPLLHIVDATAERIQNSGINKVGLLGTRLTMEDDFYKERLINKYNLEVIIPSEEERKIVHNIIFEELCLGDIQNKSQDNFLKIINNLVSNGAEAIILGCTEISTLIQQKNVKVKLFDTAKIHAEYAVDYALEK